MVNMNALHNVGNPNQTDAKRVLCVCSAGLLRSPTTANVLYKEYGYNTRAAGMEADYALIPVTDLLLHWSDEVVCMTPYQQQELMDRLTELKIHSVEVYCLNIPDRFQWNNEELQSCIRVAYANREV